MIQATIDRPAEAGTSPSRLLSRLASWLKPGRIRFLCIALIANALILLAIAFATAKGGQTAFGSLLGGDFAAFYTAGRILNTSTPERLYDVKLQYELNHDVIPTLQPSDVFLFAHAPFFAQLFRPLAFLPFPWAFLGWVLVTFGLYVSGFFFLWRTREGLSHGHGVTALLALLAFEPFLIECEVGGQGSAFGFFWMALALACDRRGRQLASGLALAFCLYKPTLLLLLLPMVVVGRRWTTLLGFGLGAVALAVLSLGTVGWRGGEEYVRLLTGYARSSAGQGAVFRTFKYVDLISFYRLVLPGHPALGRILALSAAAVAVPILLKSWWQSARLGGDGRFLLWSATLSWGLVFNLYAPAYDTILILPGVLITADILSRRRQVAGLTPSLPDDFKALLALLGIVPWITQPLAQLVGFQPYTVVLATLGAYQLRLAWRSALEDREDETVPDAALA